MKFTLSILTSITMGLVSLTFSSIAQAEASDQIWPVIQESFFKDKNIETVDYIKLEGPPKRAESGAQVPLTLTVEKPLDKADAVRKVYLFVDANPIPLTATYHFTPLNGKAQISTRIRLETDSYVRAIGETMDGKLVMSAITIRASGGCGGLISPDEQAIRATAGKMKMKVDQPVMLGKPNSATVLIKHPMFTGLQRDLASGGYRPAFYMQKLDIIYNGKQVMNVDFGVGTSEDPYLRFFYQPEAAGTMEVLATDNEGKQFTHSIQVKI